MRDWLEQLVWDAIPRVDHWLTECFEVVDSEYVRAISRRWLISAVARAFQPGCQVDHSLLLIGKQGVRKSSGLRALVPDPAWFADSLSTLGTRDSRLELAGKWICELSELSALRRADVESIKSFLTERTDRLDRLTRGTRLTFRVLAFSRQQQTSKTRCSMQKTERIPGWFTSAKLMLRRLKNIAFSFGRKLLPISNAAIRGG